MQRNFRGELYKVPRPQQTALNVTFDELRLYIDGEIPGQHRENERRGKLDRH